MAKRRGKKTLEKRSMLIALLLFSWAGEGAVCAGAWAVKRREFS
jgi:hypothetical protein